MGKYTFKTNGWETIEKFWFTPWGAPSRRLYINPIFPLRVKAGFFVIRSSSKGYIDYGGASAVFYQQVQARGRNGVTVEITQTVPAPP